MWTFWDKDGIAAKSSSAMAGEKATIASAASKTFKTASRRSGESKSEWTSVPVTVTTKGKPN
jgi:hypothetical protein